MASATQGGVANAFEEFLGQNFQKKLLRFTTAGSVDDGKSTLIGRLLHDAHGVYEDQLALVRKSKINRSGGPLDFSLITDGLRAEREQGITIDVGYRYFATPRRKFIIADTPGHEQYTRNMATGASTADAAVILVDATKGLLPQTLRHTHIAALLGIQQVLAAVNKMDLVGYREEAFREVEEKFLGLAARLGLSEVQCIPVSALEGDNVVSRSGRMPWYRGPAMLEHLETMPLDGHAETGELRLPIQMVIRPDAAFRGFAGRVASGKLRPGDKVVALPSKQFSRVKRIFSYDGALEEAHAAMSVTVQLEDEIDLSRGDMLASPENAPTVSSHFSVMMVWLHAKPMVCGYEYILKHTGRKVKAQVTHIRHRINVNTLEKEPAQELKMNEIALCEAASHPPLFFDPYVKNRTTGSFILIDPTSNATVGAGMISEQISEQDEARRGEKLTSTNAGPRVSEAERHARQGHLPLFLNCRGNAALARGVERALFDEGFQVIHLDGEKISAEESAAMAQALLGAGFVVIYTGKDISATMKSLCDAWRVRVQDFESHNTDGRLAQIQALAESLRLEER